MAGQEQEDITIADVYQAMLAQREWFGEKLAGLEASVRADVGTLREELVTVRVSIAGLPCEQRGQEIAELKRTPPRATGGLTVTLSAPSWASIAKWTIAALAGLGIAATTVRDQVGAFLWMLWGTKGS